VSDDSAFLVGFGGELVAALMSAVHGWATRVHTDGTVELRRSQDLGACPECEQDIARTHDELTAIL
jgi:hypothetical protein